ISHHLDEVFDIADRIICLRDGCCVGSGSRGELTRGELIRMMVGRDLAFSRPESAATDQPGTAQQPVALDVRSVQRKPGLPDNAFQVRRGEILGVAGLVGSGRTKMVRAILGIDRAHRRDVRLYEVPLPGRSAADALGAGIGLVPEDRKSQGLVGSASVRDNMLYAALGKLCHPVGRYLQFGRIARATNQQIELLRIAASSPQLPVRALSGGNQQKVVLAKWLLAECQVLILDEPTRGIDVGAKEEIYNLLRKLCDRGLALLVISSEVGELLFMSDRLMVMRGQRIVHTFESMDGVTEESVMHFAAGGVHDS
ncbi:MAG: ATP-binding cassette domain-containing protein, partial [Aureliella sp.]